MIREEQIREAAYSRYCNDSSITFGLSCNCFEEGAKWADKTMIDKACEWLKENIHKYQEYDESGFYHEKNKFLFKDFKKAMEE